MISFTKEERDKYKSLANPPAGSGKFTRCSVQNHPHFTLIRQYVKYVINIDRL